MDCFYRYTTHLIDEIHFINFIRLKYFMLNNLFYIVLDMLITTKILVNNCE